MTLTRRAVLSLPLAAVGARLALVTTPARAATAQPADGLAAALALEHEAVHTVPEVGARLDEATKELVRAIDADHRRQRDRLIEELRAAGMDDPPPALPAYALPMPVTDRASALDVLLVLEEALVRAYLEVAGSSTRPGHRSLAAELMARCAAHQTTLRFARARSLVDATTAFPGT